MLLWMGAHPIGLRGTIKKAIALLTWKDSKAQMGLQSKDPKKCLLRNDNSAACNAGVYVYP